MTALISAVPETARRSWLPPSGTNLFQEVKAWQAEAQTSGKKIYKLSIGQPSGPALFVARAAASDAVLLETEDMHAYADNGNGAVTDFAGRFVRCHLADAERFVALSEGDVAYLPIPGIKPMLPLVPLACGARDRPLTILTMTDPGYPTPADWCKVYPNVRHRAIRLHPGNKFLFDVSDLEGLGLGDVLMLNYPHNPSGKAADAEFWTSVCVLCADRGIRIWNDAAYTVLAHKPGLSTLSEVAVQFPGLSWAEAFSASKAGNFTGWRVGAIVGSPDFVGDIARWKGNADSGFVPFAAAGVIDVFEKDRPAIDAARRVYGDRIEHLLGILEEAGMKLAVEPEAGFFTLWRLPHSAFGAEIESARQFNRLMIQNTGIVGVHFDPPGGAGGYRYIRYAVTGDIEAMAEGIAAGFAAAKVEY